MNDTTASDCTCPSGDGSLRHPCPTHPLQRAQAQPAAAQEPVEDASNIIELLLTLAYAAWSLADNADGGSGNDNVSVDRRDFDKVSEALDALDELPDDQPGYVMEAAAKARWALRGILASPVAAAPVDPNGLILDLRAAVSIGRPLLHSDVDEIERALASAPAAPGIDLSEVPRYTLAHGDFESQMLEHSRGAWVRLSDVESALIDASPKGAVHPDELAVDAFAAAMKAKLAEARAKGRSGWNGDEPGMQQRLSDMLREHVEKGDPRDVANFCMFLHQRGEGISPKGGSDAQDGEQLALLAHEARELQRKNYGSGMGLHLDMIDWAKKFDALQALIDASPKGGSDAPYEAMYRHLQKVSPFRFKKLRDAAITDAVDVLYFHADRFDEALAAHMQATSAEVQS